MLEQKAFADHISEETLMREAGRQIAGLVQRLHPERGHVAVYCGKGHNGGDALVAAKHLAEAGWKILLSFSEEESSLRPLTFRVLKEVQSYFSQKNTSPDVILDGLLGIGARGELSPSIRRLTREMNTLKSQSNAIVVAIDLPTGLDSETGTPSPDAVIADATATIGYPKQPLLADCATAYVGRLFVLPLKELTERLTVDHVRPVVSTPEALAPLFPHRSYMAHKGTCGRVSIVAGSVGFLGAAVLTANAAVHAGAGLVTVFTLPEVYPLLAGIMPPEIMVRPVDSLADVLNTPADSLAIGPGLGVQGADVIRKITQEFRGPAIVDADALNAWAEKPVLAFQGPRLFTPHPGEMHRLYPNADMLSRIETAQQFVSKTPVTLLLKGSRSIIAEQGKAIAYNPTGGPALAKGGSGDVLTGVCAALGAQGLSLYDSARVGAWLCGRASEFAVAEVQSPESVTPQDVIRNLGKALYCLRSRKD